MKKLFNKLIGTIIIVLLMVALAGCSHNADEVDEVKNFYVLFDTELNPIPHEDIEEDNEYLLTLSNRSVHMTVLENGEFTTKKLGKFDVYVYRFEGTTLNRMGIFLTPTELDKLLGGE